MVIKDDKSAVEEETDSSSSQTHDTGEIGTCTPVHQNLQYMNVWMEIHSMGNEGAMGYGVL